MTSASKARTKAEKNRRDSDDADHYEAAHSAEAFLENLRESARTAQDLIEQNGEMSKKIQSLEGELASSKTRIAFLEEETSRLRSSIAAGASTPDQQMAEQLRQLIEEQNCLAHLFVASDRLSTVGSPKAAVAAADEVLHNMVGAHRYSLWLHWPSTERLILVASAGDGSRDDDRVLAQECIAKAKASRDYRLLSNKAPLVVPLMLGTDVIGAVVVTRLVSHLPSPGRLQRDLLALLGQRVGFAICAGAVHQRIQAPRGLWKEMETVFQAKTEAEYA